MGKIRILPSTLVNQIAAGEVIERPASIVKELVENSIDAGATQIDILIEKGGIQSIQVRDNGSGMGQGDLDLCFKRHATSKIATPDDLTHIRSLGFRGEALPSIASVALVTALSAKDESGGFECSIEGGQTRYFRPAAALKGTSITVKNLFFNVPARRKFLKKKETETRVITAGVRNFVLAHPEIGFNYTADQKEVFRLKSGSLESRIRDIYGKYFTEALLPVKDVKDRFSVEGFIGNLSLVKKRMGEQFLFLNGRPIRDRLLNSAVYGAYKSLLSRGEYPFFVLNLGVPEELVDVNVHPSKLEVRFQDEWRVYYVVKSAVTQALKDILATIPDFDYFNRRQAAFQGSSQTGSLDLTAPGKSAVDYPIETAPRPSDEGLVRNGDSHGLTDQKIERAHQRIEKMMGDVTLEKSFVIDRIWQLHNKYLITEVKSGMIIIDQHVAHERILFEAAKKAMEEKGLPSQTVLFPQTLTLQPEEFSRFLEIVPYLEKIGFRLREFGRNSIVIDGVPPDIYMGGEDRIIRDILDKYMSEHDLGSSFLDYIAATYACKAAIKAGDKLEPEEMRSLLDKLFATEHPYYCPHGRPIVVNLTTDELDHRFERT
ncbi:MAG: DNA mismatch repair endonuclease MutL [FCB group bacterium]|nr:DNA mismatch repair endonuclease MutL [FCB group bacterium]